MKQLLNPIAAQILRWTKTIFIMLAFGIASFYAVSDFSSAACTNNWHHSLVSNREQHLGLAESDLLRHLLQFGFRSAEVVKKGKQTFITIQPPCTVSLIGYLGLKYSIRGYRFHLDHAGIVKDSYIQK